LASFRKLTFLEGFNLCVRSDASRGVYGSDGGGGGDKRIRWVAGQKKREVTGRGFSHLKAKTKGKY